MCFFDMIHMKKNHVHIYNFVCHIMIFQSNSSNVRPEVTFFLAKKIQVLAAVILVTFFFASAMNPGIIPRNESIPQATESSNGGEVAKWQVFFGWKKNE